MILSAVRAIRRDRALHEWFTERRTASDDAFLLRAIDGDPTLIDLIGVQTDDHLASAWLMRVLLTLVAWPVADATTERALVDRYVAVGFQRAD